MSFKSQIEEIQNDFLNRLLKADEVHDRVLMCFMNIY